MDTFGSSKDRTRERSLLSRFCLLAFCSTISTESAGAANLDALLQPWPEPGNGRQVEAQHFPFPSASPFTLADVRSRVRASGPTGSAIKSAQAAVPAEALGSLFLPPAASAETPVPAVILLHGARGVSDAREVAYARQFAAMGLAALVVDVFASRQHLATSFIARVFEITESMSLADAYAALGALAALPEVDADRIALVGFSYGGMVTLYAAHEQVAELYDELFDLQGRRFAAHAAYYAPCIARFEDRRATGAPVLMQWGSKDEVVDSNRCEQTAEELRQGGADVETIVYRSAYHMWDGNHTTPWRAPRGLADCDFQVTRSASIRGRLWGTPFYLAMTGSLSRKILLGLCSDSDGYLIGRNIEVRAQSNAALGRFLAEALR